MVAASDRAVRPVRCAIYARKSTEEGLEKEFNSLDAQREAAEAYIESQKAQGLVALPERYEDGGFTGGNMERPALRSLFSHIEVGRVDCVVVYKVDRLSRSLLDFARMMALFEQHQVSFVAVTQEFNTRTPVGRLTLHMLLSFAQFEREIISERTRDKKAAARRKGKWIGGYVPLGYDLDRDAGKLVVNDEEAERVRTIFGLFAGCGSLEETLATIHELGWTTKAWVTEDGRRRRGSDFSRHTLRRLLCDVLYVGAVCYQGQQYPGEHSAMVGKRLWNRVAEKLRSSAPGPHRTKRNSEREPHELLAGLLYCGRCAKLMRPTSTQRHGCRYAYYVCGGGCGARLNASRIEESALRQLQSAAGSRRKVRRLVRLYEGREGIVSADVRDKLRAIVASITYDPQSESVTIQLHEVAVAGGGSQWLRSAMFSRRGMLGQSARRRSRRNGSRRRCRASPS
jgi:site-specific DNA recombinase